MYSKVCCLLVTLSCFSEPLTLSNLCMEQLASLEHESQGLNRIPYQFSLAIVNTFLQSFKGMRFEDEI